MAGRLIRVYARQMEAYVCDLLIFVTGDRARYQPGAYRKTGMIRLTFIG